MRRPRYTQGSGAPLSSTPHLLVNRVLRCNGSFKSGIFSPASGNIAQVALAHLGVAQAESASKGLDCHFVQALALLPGRIAESGIEILRHIANRILNANIVGSAGINCKQVSGLASETWDNTPLRNQQRPRNPLIERSQDRTTLSR